MAATENSSAVHGFWISVARGVPRMVLGWGEEPMEESVS